MKIYQIDSSARKDGSTSRALAKKILEKIKKPEDEVIYRDLNEEMVFVTGLTESGMNIEEKDQNENHKKMFKLSDQLVKELKESDVIIISTPQEIALADVKRGIKMFDKLNVPIIGLVDNMSFFETDDGKKYNIFGEGGVEKVSNDYKKNFLGKIPIDVDLRISADEGTPLVEKNPDHKISKKIFEIAKKVKSFFH